jgi:hypothetical protein
MAKTIPKKTKNGKKKIDFSKLAIELKELVSFNVDLRKTDRNPSIAKGNDSLSFGIRMALLKAAREIRELGVSSQFIPIKRERGESKSAHRKRVSNTKSDMGQTGTHFPGVFLNTPDFVKPTVKRIRDDRGRFTSQIETTVKGPDVKLEVGSATTTTRELYVPVNPREFSKDPITALNTIRNKYKDADRIVPVHSGFRGTGSRVKDKTDYRRFRSKLLGWAYKYDGATNNDGSPDTKKQKHWLSGFLIVWYDITPKKGSRGKRI